MDNTTKNMVLSTAENIVNKIKYLETILHEARIDLPAEYDASKQGGYLCIYHQTMGLILLEQIGEISYREDPEFGDKARKYRNFALQKCVFLLTSKKKASEETDFGIKGGIRMGDNFFLGYSGNIQNLDQLIVICLALKTRHLIDPSWNPLTGHDLFRKLIKKLCKKGNPFLDETIYTKI